MIKRSALMLSLIGLVGCQSTGPDYSKKPKFIVGDISVTQFVQNQGDDLMTGGGFNPATGEVVAELDTANATPSALRKYNVAANYKSIMDPITPGGWQVFWGPTVVEDIHSHDASGFTGLVSGYEYVGTVDDGSGTVNVTLVVQVPDTFDPETPCL